MRVYFIAISLLLTLSATSMAALESDYAGMWRLSLAGGYTLPLRSAPNSASDSYREYLFSSGKGFNWSAQLSRIRAPRYAYGLKYSGFLSDFNQDSVLLLDSSQVPASRQNQIQYIGIDLGLYHRIRQSILLELALGTGPLFFEESEQLGTQDEWQSTAVTPAFSVNTKLTWLFFEYFGLQFEANSLWSWIYKEKQENQVSGQSIIVRNKPIKNISRIDFSAGLVYFF